MSNTILLTVGLVHVLFKFNHNNEAESISTILRQSGQGSGERRGNYACIMPKNILHNRHKSIYCQVVGFKQGTVYTHV